jgi:putative transcriptional regulator
LKNKVKHYREQFGLTQAQLGQKVNVSRQAINAIEKNKFDPSIWLAYDLAKFFNMSIEELFEFEESERK